MCRMFTQTQTCRKKTKNKLCDRQAHQGLPAFYHNQEEHEEMLAIGIDPGTAICGFGLVEMVGNKLT